jgi:hypothetical protein
MPRSLSDLIREGFADAVRDGCSGHVPACAEAREPALQGLSWSQVSSLMHRRTVPAAQQDELLAAAIRSYRRGPAQVWGPVLLSMLGPALVTMAARLRSCSRAIDGEDLDQQVVLEALRACDEMPLPDGCRFVLRRVVLLANKRLTRWAQRETRHLAQLDAFPELMEVLG